MVYVVLLDRDNQQPLTVSAYFADPQLNPPPLNAEYKALILSGARFCRLSEEYIRERGQIEVSG